MPRETLTRDRIVAAAIELLDQDGIEALSMRKLGQRIDSAATSMYWHVGNKENLISLASDRAWTEIELPDVGREDWQSAAAALATNAFALLIRHHWLVTATTTHFVYGPGQARYQDHNYAIYEAAGFEGADLDWAFNTMFNFILGAAVGESLKVTLRTRLVADNEAEAKINDHLRRADEIAGAFPRLKARIIATEATGRETTTQDAFDYGIETILDGLAARLARG